MEDANVNRQPRLLLLLVGRGSVFVDLFGVRLERALHRLEQLARLFEHPVAEQLLDDGRRLAEDGDAEVRRDGRAMAQAECVTHVCGHLRRLVRELVQQRASREVRVALQPRTQCTRGVRGGDGRLQTGVWRLRRGGESNQLNDGCFLRGGPCGWGREAARHYVGHGD